VRVCKSQAVPEDSRGIPTKYKYVQNLRPVGNCNMHFKMAKLALFSMMIKNLVGIIYNTG
jgi:hypothetical protein